MGHGGSRKGAGRPKGKTPKTTKIESILEGKFEDLTAEYQKTQEPTIDPNELDTFVYNKLLELSNAGDARAINLLLDRYLKKAPVKPRTQLSDFEKQEIQKIYQKFKRHECSALEAMELMEN